jgi:hypothetical protein
VGAVAVPCVVQPERRTAVKLEITREGIEITPESEVEVAYINNTLGEELVVDVKRKSLDIDDDYIERVWLVVRSRGYDD